MRSTRSARCRRSTRSGPASPRPRSFRSCASWGSASSPTARSGGGFLTGTIRSIDALAEDDFRRYQPRFQGDNLEANIAIVEVIDALAAERGATAAQVALAWVHAQGEDVVPIPGTKRRTYLEDNVGALDVELSARDLERLAGAGEAAGERYPDMSPINR